MTTLTLESHDGIKVRAVVRDEMLFSLYDVCEALGVSSAGTGLNKIISGSVRKEKAKMFYGVRPMRVIPYDTVLMVAKHVSERKDVSSFMNWFLYSVSRIATRMSDKAAVANVKSILLNPDFGIALLKELKKFREQEDEEILGSMLRDGVKHIHKSLRDWVHAMHKSGLPKDVGERRVIDLLTDKGMLVRGSDNRLYPVKKYIDNGLFALERVEINNGGTKIISRQTRITKVGESTLSERVIQFFKDNPQAYAKKRS